MKKSIVGGILYFLFSALFLSPSFASFKDGSYHVRPSDPIHKTINSVLNLGTIKNPAAMSGSGSGSVPVKVYVHNEGTPYREVIELNAGMREVELIGVPDAFGNKPIIDGSGGDDKPVIAVVFKEKNAGSIHGFIIQGGIIGVKITGSDLKLYNNEIRNNEYGINVSFAYGPEPSGPDLDNDGVKDEVDSCPGTLIGNNVNRNGCSNAQISLLGDDSDNDGVPDGSSGNWIDQCPGTVQMPDDTPPLPDIAEAYIPVNVDGCPYGDIFNNNIHGNSEWNISVFTNKAEASGDNFVTQPLIRNNDIHDSKLGIAVRSNATGGVFGSGVLNLRPIIYANKIYDIKGKGGITGMIMGAINVVNNGYAKIIGNDIGDSLLTVSRGISFSGGSGVVFSNDIHHTALRGGSSAEGGVNIAADSFDVLVMNNRIYSNSSNGVSFTSTNGIKIINNTIDSNAGHGVMQDASSGIVKNNILSFNNGYGYQLNVAYVGSSSYNGFWKNKLGSYGGGADTATGDLEAEPLYVNGAPSDWDYHLLSSSKLIDAGDPTDSCFNEPSTPGKPACRVDMGAYGNTGEATIPGDSTADSDGDGTYDTDDRCPNTPFPTPVMAGYGCSEAQADGDNDGDNVKNINDECRNTPSGVEVDLKGCPPANNIDSDGDGTMDPFDRCPGTLAGEKVDFDGCSNSQQKDDSDGDGVYDKNDECPNTPKGVTVDGTGCPVSSQGDLDGDGVTGASDRCQNTASSDIPLPAGGVGTPYGCSPNQLGNDGDGDKVFDYMDECPNTPSNIPVTVKGCTQFLGDFDADGVTDNIDACPATPVADRNNVDTRGCTVPQAIADDDVDSVQNGDDLCQGTRVGTEVDTDGCETPASDIDGDGVPDYIDRCHGTLASDLPLPSESVFGCGASQLNDDSDGDSVVDPADKCPGSLAEVDSDGCSLAPLDDDGDSVVNALDRCPGTASVSVVNAFGCSEAQIPTDTDQDKVRDMLDRCAGTPPGSIVDAVGCIDKAKNDTDGDGVVDIADRCSDTATGASVDPAHGCSERQMTLDDDNDLVPNYRDQCPGTEAGETVEDASGCPMAIIGNINLTTSSHTSGGIELKWDRFQGSAADFKGYYIYRSENSEVLDSLGNDLYAVLAPSITWQGAFILTALLGLGFFVMDRRKMAGVMFFVVGGVLMTSVYIRANTAVDASKPLKIVSDIEQTTYIDKSAGFGVKYFYRVFAASKSLNVYPTNIASLTLFDSSGKSGNFVSSTSPFAGALDVKLNAPIVIAFNEPMDPSTINGTTVLLAKGGNISVAGRVVYNAANMTLTYTPLGDLEPAVTHTFTITTGVRSLAGGSLPFDYRFTFMTEFVSSTSAEDRYFPLNWTGTLRDRKGAYLTMNFSMTSTTDISTGPTAGGGVGPGGSVGPGGNSLMTISGSFSDGTEVVGRVEYKCPNNGNECTVSEALTNEYAIFLSRSSGGTLVFNGTLSRIGELWAASGSPWRDDRPFGWHMLFRNWSASPSN